MTDNDKIDYLLRLIFSPAERRHGAPEIKLFLNRGQYIPLQHLAYPRFWEQKNKITRLEIKIEFAGHVVFENEWSNFDELVPVMVVHFLEEALSHIILHGYSNLCESVSRV